MHSTYQSVLEGADSEEGMDQQGQQYDLEDSGANSTSDKKLQMLYIQMEFCPRTLKVSSLAITTSVCVVDLMHAV